jgi:hypothetical protein
MSAPPILCTPFGLQVGNSAGVPTTASLLIGGRPIDVPSDLGGSLLVLPFGNEPISLVGSPTFVPLPFLCDTRLCGVVVFFQVLMPDPNANHGFSFTPGLAMRLGGP